MLGSNLSAVAFKPGPVVSADQIEIQKMSQLRLDAVANPLIPFVGPMDDAAGTRQIAAGQELTDDEMDRMCWYVDGIKVFDDAGAEQPLADLVAECQN
ncbi:MAG: hypothetical protein H6734_18145 [Alphaproteobacteria bacterium]|nr:hypothetical protein [Alphaproteobacteria bacterium]